VSDRDRHPLIGGWTSPVGAACIVIDVVWAPM